MKTILLSFTVLFFGCTSPKTTVQEPETPREVCEAFIAAVQAGDREGSLEYVVANLATEVNTDFGEMAEAFMSVDFVYEDEACQKLTQNGAQKEQCIVNYKVIVNGEEIDHQPFKVEKVDGVWRVREF